MPKIIYNNIIPFKGFIAMNFFGIIFIRNEYKNYRYLQRTINHELIHTAQMKELFYIGFYILYFLEWIFNLIFHTKTAYRDISFEKEAYDNENDIDYLSYREKFAMWKK